MGIAAPRAGGGCDATCAEVCTTLAELFEPTVGAVSAGCQSAVQQLHMNGVDDLVTLYQTQQACVGCCILDEALPGQPVCNSVRCPAVTCEGLRVLYSSTSRVYGECPAELPAELRAVALTPDANLLKEFVKLDEWSLPPLVQQCASKLSVRFPQVQTKYYNSSVCKTETVRLVDRMNNLLKLARNFEVPANRSIWDHLVFYIVMFVAVSLLLFTIYKNKEYAAEGVGMGGDTSVALAEYLEKLKTKSVWGASDAIFKPVISDWKRATVSYLAADGTPFT